jgi:hypothetical protein
MIENRAYQLAINIYSESVYSIEVPTPLIITIILYLNDNTVYMKMMLFSQ